MLVDPYAPPGVRLVQAAAGECPRWSEIVESLTARLPEIAKRAAAEAVIEAAAREAADENG